ncbi:hypothetical protein R3P38DRAFT_3235306 [Favolaschia claudopus]|uniref:Uncharacterized protein n=1 Tax=Favolaschia claudopus TaxID=2862362 RepID=A0AAV9ZED5_9AGAR
MTRLLPTLTQQPEHQDFASVPLASTLRRADSLDSASAPAYDDLAMRGLLTLGPSLYSKQTPYVDLKKCPELLPNIPPPASRARQSNALPDAAQAPPCSLAHPLVYLRPPVPPLRRNLSPSVPPDSPLCPAEVELLVSNPVTVICWTQNGTLGKALTIYPRADSNIRLADNKILLGAHTIEKGNRVQRFIPVRRNGRMTGKGWWSRVKWDSAIPVRSDGSSRILLRYNGVDRMPDWDAQIAALH